MTRLIRPDPKPVYELALRDASGDLETFHATGDHRWKGDSKGWIATADLKAGDRIDTGSNADVTITSVFLTNIVERTYNLEVADWHTFMVGRDHVVVHNGCSDPMRDAFLRQLEQHGRQSLVRSRRSIASRLTEHQRKLAEIRAIGGYASSVEREIRTYQQQLQVIDDILGR